MAEPKQKKPKGEIHPIFQEFKINNKETLAKMEDTCNIIEHGYSKMNLCLLKIEETDARASQSFSCATCTTSIYEEGGLPVTYSIGSFFVDGLETLRNYLKEETEIPQDKPSRKALQKLLEFLHSSMTSIDPPKKNQQKDCNCMWAVQLAQSLFSKLAVGCRYTLAEHYFKDQQRDGNIYSCPCGQKELLEGSFGDTSFGCPDAWHGSVDILLEDLPVSITTDDVQGAPRARNRLSSDSSDCGNESSDEMNTGEGFSSRQLSQIVSQTIVFSFLQRKQKGYTLENCLIPSVGVKESSFIVFFYDCENDVLFQSDILNLFFYGKVIDIRMVVFLWLTLNYRCFCTGVTEAMKSYKAFFSDHVGDDLSKYEQEVTKPVGRRLDTDEGKKNWANEPGRISKNEGRIKFQMLHN